jgi:hypothetical protein
LRKIRAHRIRPEEVEQGLSNSPTLIYEQDVQGKIRYIYYCGTGGYVRSDAMKKKSIDMPKFANEGEAADRIVRLTRLWPAVGFS